MEAIWVEIMQKIQVKASEEGLEMVIGEWGEPDARLERSSGVSAVYCSGFLVPAGFAKQGRFNRTGGPITPAVTRQRI
jgi:hypothetical protein